MVHLDMRQQTMIKATKRANVGPVSFHIPSAKLGTLQRKKPKETRFSKTPIH